MVSACMLLPPAWLDFDCAVSEVVASIANFFFYSLSFSSLVAFRSSARSLPPFGSGVSFTSAYLGRFSVDAKMGLVLICFSTSTNWTVARRVDARRR